MGKVILHIDMNAFFATVEKILDPSLKDKPIVIGHDSSRSVVSTACYLARKYGIKSAMPMYKAKQLCPHITIVNGHYDQYEIFRDKFLKIIYEYTKIIEVASIDECYADLTEYINKNKNVDAYKIIKEIQDRIFNETKLLCSIGVAPNKFLAKMASDYKKPMGITIIRLKDVPSILWPISIDYMYGIGKKTAPRLKNIDILTIGDLAKSNEENTELKKILGKNTRRYIDLANGIDNSIVIVEEPNNKSIGHSLTLPNNTSDFDIIHDYIKELAKRVSNRAKEQRLLGNNVGIVLKYSDFSVCNRSIKIRKYTNSYEDIIATATKLLENNFNGEVIRLVGVTLNDLLEEGTITYQSTIDFNKKVEEIKDSKTDEIISSINKKFNKNIVKKASD